MYDPSLNWRPTDTTTKTKAKIAQCSDSSYSEIQEQGHNFENIDLTESSHKKSVSEPGHSAAGNSSLSEHLNKKAVIILEHIQAKLTGKDFNTEEPVDV